MTTPQARYRLANLDKVKAMEKRLRTENLASKRFFCTTCQKALSTAGNLRVHIAISKEHFIKSQINLPAPPIA